MIPILSATIVIVIVAIALMVKKQSVPIVNTTPVASTGNAQVDDILKDIKTDAQLGQQVLSGVQDILNVVSLQDNANASGGGFTDLPAPSLVESTPEDYSALSIPIMTLQPTVAASIQSAGQAGGGIDRFDEFFQKYADIYGVNPVIVKAVCQTESTGNPLAFNPVAKDYHNRTATANLHKIWKQIRSEILADPGYGLNVLTKFDMDPSMGLMQVRYSTAYGMNKTLYPVDLFDGETCIALGAKFLSILQRTVNDLQTNVDAYNMGLGNWLKGRRNYDYLSKTQNNMVKFQHDFE